MTAPERSWSPEKGTNRDTCVRRKGKKKNHSPGPGYAEVRRPLELVGQPQRGALLFRSESIPESSFLHRRLASALFWP